MMIDNGYLSDIESMQKMQIDVKDFLIGMWGFCTLDMEDIISVRHNLHYHRSLS